MRRSSGSQKPETISVDPGAFGWDPALVATLDHSTLPWSSVFGEATSIAATPLSRCGAIATRDALSLLGQFAAHEALLRAAGVSDVAFDPEAWAVARERGRDVRLVRLHARGKAVDEPAVAIETFGQRLGTTGLETLAQSWLKPESVYVEIARRLRADAAADLTWFRRAAAGVIRAPGLEALRAVEREAATFTVSDDPTAALTRFAQLTRRRVFILGGADCSPLRRGSALAVLEPLIGTAGARGEGEIAEAIESALGPDAILVITNPEHFDALSRDVVAIVAASPGRFTRFIDDAGCIARDGVIPASRDLWFFVSQRIAPRRELEAAVDAIPQSERPAWADAFVGGAAWEPFVLDGTLPAPEPSPALAALREPRRSYLAALAMAGEAVDASAARQLLEQLDCKLAFDDLVVPPIARHEGERIVFASTGLRRQLVELLPLPTRAAIARVAAPLIKAAGDPVQAARILVDAAEYREAEAILEERLPTGPAAAALESFPRDFIAASPKLAAAFAEHLTRCGRLSDARALARGASQDETSYLLARVERRRGNYAAALEQLRSIAAPGTRALLLQGEILRLDGAWDEARKHLEAAKYASSPEDVARIDYEVALIDLDAEGRTRESIAGIPPEHYLNRRYAAYVALADSAYDVAIEASEAAVAASADAEEKIDALLDLVYARFMAGQWLEARHDGVAALAVIEETQGDRAAGGILLTLGYLAADSGQWERAGNIATRLRRFYREAGDEVRARDVDLMLAQLSLGRGDFREAHRLASNLLSEKLLPAVREGAALIADECDWMEEKLSILRSSGSSGCRELDDRHRFLNAVLTGRGAETIVDPFGCALADWVIQRTAGRGGDPPVAGSEHEHFRLMRAIFAVGRRRNDQALLDRAAELARSAGVALAFADPRTRESRDATLLRRLGTASYPFESDAFGDIAWRFATRNRLGQWSESGSLPPLGAAECEKLLHDPTPDVAPCGAAAFVQIPELAGWSDESRSAIAAIFRLRQEHHNLKRAIEQESESVREAAPRADGIVGESPAIRALHARIASAARSDIAACILGESGTGKELIARGIHRGSGRRSKPFTPLNCAALPEHLVESELFGHVRGAFTGADRDRVGVIEASDGGTLFLDEIGELPLQAQAKLLRFLQEGEFRRVGDSSNRTADVRIVAATNRKLEQAVDDGKFREDLFYRIVGIEIPVPPLRERGSDILLLANFFLEQERKKLRNAPARFSPDVEAVFLSHRWPGNVRELQNAVRAACAIAADAREIDLEHLPDRLRNVLIVRTQTGTYYEEVVRFRRSLIETSLAEAKGNQSQAAKSLGMSRQALAYQIRELGIMVKG